MLLDFSSNILGVFTFYYVFLDLFLYFYYVYYGWIKRAIAERESKEAKNFMYGMCKVDMNVPKSKSLWLILAFTLQLHTSVGVLVTHVSKWPSDLKINCTQENVTFSDPGFHGLPFGVLLFAVSVSFKNHKIEAPDWLLKNCSHSEGGF